MEIEVQDIFQQYGEQYLNNHNLSLEQWKAFRAISICRTAALGAHIETCDECEAERISYNSCRNRHCPKCGTFAKEEWLDRQSENLLDCEYFHVVFTVPADLRAVFYQNQTTMYNLLFRAVSETLHELCANKKYLGAKPGITAVLHTWGQNLSYHPHLHCVVTGGGLTHYNSWNDTKNNFFIPVNVLAKLFRGKLLSFVQKAELSFYGTSRNLNNPNDFDALIDKLYKIDWIVYCKHPFGNAQNVLDYLGRYTHRVAISNNRIVNCSDGKVVFTYRDYSDDNKQKVMTLSADEFIRRFLMHVLPGGFRKIRHFGLFASRNKGKIIKLCRRLTNTKFTPRKETPEQRLERVFGKDYNLCPHCNIGHFRNGSP